MNDSIDYYRFLFFYQLIDQGLSEQISYLSRVSTMHSHEGSNYGGEKVC